VGLLESSEKMVVIPYYSLSNFTFGSCCLYFSFKLSTLALSFILEMTSEDLPPTDLLGALLSQHRAKEPFIHFLIGNEKNG
jgi:hypothetical protein